MGSKPHSRALSVWLAALQTHGSVCRGTFAIWGLSTVCSAHSGCRELCDKQESFSWIKVRQPRFSLWKILLKAARSHTTTLFFFFSLFFFLLMLYFLKMLIKIKWKKRYFDSVLIKRLMDRLFRPVSPLVSLWVQGSVTITLSDTWGTMCLNYFFL